jgi:hypothetical protein
MMHSGEKKKINSALRLKAGELIEVRSKEEILSTLDADACLDGLPFMPEMFRYCGLRFSVYKRAHKSCDTVFPTRSRRMANAVHLETRCDGGAHGGCQAGCLIFWKEAWLKRVNSDSAGNLSSPRDQVLKIGESQAHKGCTEDDVWRWTVAVNQDGEEPTYICQATRLPYATTDLRWWDIRQYLEDFRSGNVGLVTILRGLINAGFYRLSLRLARLQGVVVRALHAVGVRRRWGIGDRPMVWFYDTISSFFGGTPWPRKSGSIPIDKPTPVQTLDLQPGELVRVKSYEEILSTLNARKRNRGMSFDKEMVPYCGGEYRVLKRVSRIINEQTGKMQEMKTPSIILDSVVCQSRYSEKRLFCPRSIYNFWREIWLERVTESELASGGANELCGSGVDVRAHAHETCYPISETPQQRRPGSSAGNL